MMQGRPPISQAPMSRVPSSDDLQKLLKAAQSGTLVQQPILIPGKAKFVLKVHLPKAGPGLGRSREANSMPVWSLHEGLNSIWQHSTVDLELILNMVEEGVYSSHTKSGTAIPILNMLGEPDSSMPSTSNPIPAVNPAPTANQIFRPLDPASQSSTNNPTLSQTASALTQRELSGNLSELGVLELIELIGLEQRTGRLDITSGLQSIEIFFEKGTPVRASYRNDSMSGGVKDMTGEEVVLEGMTWKRGFFQFNPVLQSAERSPMRRLEYLLKDGANLRDYLESIESLGLIEDAVPLRTRKVSESEFERAMSLAVPVNIEEQKSMYVAFDGKKTVEEVVRESGLPKSVWLPILYNLSKAGFIGLKAQEQSSEPPVAVNQTPMVKEAVKDAFSQLLRADTGMISYPLFMHFLEVEYQRALKLRLPISLIIVSVHKQEDDVREQLSSEDLKLVAAKMRARLEPYDYLGHYQTFDIALLMPHRPSAIAREQVTMMISEFNQELAQSGTPVRLVWTVGIGCIPEDGIKTEAILTKAERDKVPV